ncbi:MAG: hypothetical protein ABIK28_03390 [Planctomycetota bacterium]
MSNKTVLSMAVLSILGFFSSCQNMETQIGDMIIYHQRDLTTEPVRVAYTGMDCDTLFALCREVFKDQGIPVRFAENNMIRSKTMQEEGVSWRLYVKLSQAGEEVLVESYMKIQRHTDVEFDPVGSLIDSWLKSGPKHELEKLEKAHERGEIQEPDYYWERRELEDQIEAEEEARRRAWEEDNQERIERVTERGRSFHSLLEALIKRNAPGVSTGNNAACVGQAHKTGG